MTNLNDTHGGRPGGGLPPEMALAEVDGITVTGPRGNLRVVLSADSLEVPLHSPTVTHWLLPLDNPDVARHAAEVKGEVLWICSRPPSDVAGGLVLDFCGAWLESSTAILQFTEPEYYDVAGIKNPVSALARIAAMRWAGYSPAAIKNFLSLKNKEKKKPFKSKKTAHVIYE